MPETNFTSVSQESLCACGCGRFAYGVHPYRGTVRTATGESALELFAVACVYQCDECGGWFTRRDGAWSDHNAICYVRCACGCGRRSGSYFGIDCEGVERSDFCDECVRECANCGTWYSINDGAYDDHAEVCYRYDDGDGLESYGFKPSPSFASVDESGALVVRDFPGVGSVAFFGVEVETEGAGSSVVPILEGVTGSQSGRWYAKEDGSLNESGAELVSHPATLAWWQSCLFDVEALFRDLRWAGARSWGREDCGLHVHVGRDAFTGSAHLARFGLLFDRNRESVQRVARRASSWARFHDGEGMVGKAKGEYPSDHYDAVNVRAQSGRTVEVRVFRPSLRAGRVVAAVELVAAAVDYTRALTAHDIYRGALDWGRFDRWAREDWGCAVSLPTLLDGRPFSTGVESTRGEF